MPVRKPNKPRPMTVPNTQPEMTAKRTPLRKPLTRPRALVGSEGATMAVKTKAKTETPFGDVKVQKTQGPKPVAKKATRTKPRKDDAPFGYKADGTPKLRPGRPSMIYEDGSKPEFYIINFRADNAVRDYLDEQSGGNRSKYILGLIRKDAKAKKAALPEPVSGGVN
jgi:hypothetical protein